MYLNTTFSLNKIFKPGYRLTANGNNFIAGLQSYLLPDIQCVYTVCYSIIGRVLCS